MQQNLDFLVLYVEITMAFIAFSTIVSTLRQTFGAELSRLQVLLFHFFVEVGFLHLLIALSPIALFTIMSDELLIWRFTTYTILVVTSVYVPFYVRRRLQIKERVPWISRAVIVGYGVAVILMLATATEWFWLPSLQTTTCFLVWGLVSNVALFAYFLRTFVGSSALGPDR